MSNPTTGGKIPLPDVPSSLTPTEALQQMAVTVKSVMNEIVAVMTPFVAEGLQRATDAQKAAEAELVALAGADPSSLPSHLSKMRSLLAGIYQEGGAADTLKSGAATKFPSLITAAQDDYAGQLTQQLINDAQAGVLTAGLGQPLPAPMLQPTPISIPASKPVVTVLQSAPLSPAIPKPPVNPTPQQEGAYINLLSSMGLKQQALDEATRYRNANPKLFADPTAGQSTVAPVVTQSPPLPTVTPSPPVTPVSPPQPVTLPPAPITASITPIPVQPAPIPPMPPVPPFISSDCPPCVATYFGQLQQQQNLITAALNAITAALSQPCSVTVNTQTSPTTNSTFNDYFGGSSYQSTSNVPVIQPANNTTSTQPAPQNGQATQPAAQSVFPKPSQKAPYDPSKSPQQVPSVPTVGSLNIPNFNAPDVCDFTKKWGLPTLGAGHDDVYKWLKNLTTSNPGVGLLDSLKSTAKSVPVLGSFIVSLIDTVISSSQIAPLWLVQLANKFGQELGCNIGDAALPITMETLIGIAAKYIGANFDDYAIPFTQWRRYVCPTELPSIADANAAYLTDEITDGQWECWVRANNGLPAPNRTVRNAARSRLSRDEYVSLLLRGNIDADTYQQKIRELGFTKADDVKGIEDLSVALPGIGDIIRFLVRDVGDTRIVETFGLDESFEAKWSDELAHMAKSQGISPNLAKLYWRAHWDIPSPTQLYTMLHRLRPGRVSGIDTTKQVGPLTAAQQKARLSQNDLVVTRDDVMLALQQDDIAPFWVNRLMAVSYRPLTRTDVRSAYVQSSIDRKELTEALQDFGYDPPRAETLARIYDNMKVRTLLRYPELQLYMKGALSVEEITLFLKGEGVEDNLIVRIINKADFRAKAQFRGACLKETMQQYYKGKISVVELRQQIRNLGLTLAHANKLISNAECEAKHQDKEATMAQVAQLYFDDLLKANDLTVRLVRIGYGIDLAKLLSADMIKRKEIRDGKAAEAETRREQIEQRRKDREAEKIAKEAAKAAKKGKNAEPPTPLTVPPIVPPK